MMIMIVMMMMMMIMTEMVMMIMMIPMITRKSNDTLVLSVKFSNDILVLLLVLVLLLLDIIITYSKMRAHGTMETFNVTIR